ncbi:hypothetical protein ACFL6M_02465 [Candidatus Eisenbacteria bacterium]|uniref:TIGR02391 family protein n=1 Tax=Eiseniibacteriota bacterium TaxID=2212470 RepID=A0ABV6YJD0_UNCEI
MPTSANERDRLKRALLDAFRECPRTQYLEIVRRVKHRMQGALPRGYEQILLELVHELIVSNVVMTGMNEHNTGWPWLAVTTHGSQVLSQEGPAVYDYEGFLHDLQERVPHLDSIVKRYISESLQAYQRNLFYASMVMLGIASERAIRVLVEAYVASVDSAKAKTRLQSKLNGRDISTVYKTFRRSFDTTRSQVTDASLPNEFDVHVDSVYNFVRLLRNAVAHPGAMPNITSALVYANLQQFSLFSETIFRLVSYYESNQTRL